MAYGSHEDVEYIFRKSVEEMLVLAHSLKYMIQKTERNELKQEISPYLI